MATRADFANPADLERKASECDREGDKLEEIINRLQKRSEAVFTSWKGIAAYSLRDGIGRQITMARSAQRQLRQAASALRNGANEVRESIRRAEEEERKRTQAK